MEDSTLHTKIKNQIPLVLLIAFSLVTAIYPVVRAFYHFEVNYNEGWNLYNAAAVAHHIPLYGAKYGWTTVNYPMLSFYFVSVLTRITHDYLLAGRLISLFSLGISCALVGLIIRKVAGDFSAALFGSFFCLALFCTSASSYVGADDPQMLAQIFFLGGLLVYLCRPHTFKWMVIIALLFAVGGNVKHSLIDFPLALVLDLGLVSRRKAAQFILLLGFFAGISAAINTWAGGAFFVSNLLSGRTYSLVRAMLNFANEYVPLLLLLVAAWIWASSRRSGSPDRIFSLLFFSSLVIGIALGGGEGVSINSYFDNFLAMSMIAGLIFHALSESRLIGLKRFRVPGWGFAGISLASLILASFFFGNGLFWRRIAELPRDRAQFDRQVSLLANHPGPVICESLLRCYAAGKPYIYDPFNSERFMRAGKLDSKEIVDRIAAREFSSIQLSLPVTSFEELGDELPRAGFHPVRFAVIQLGPYGAIRERFPDAILQAINRYYELSASDPDCVIYTPKSDMSRPQVKSIHY